LHFLYILKDFSLCILFNCILYDVLFVLGLAKTYVEHKNNAPKGFEVQRLVDHVLHAHIKAAANRLFISVRGQGHDVARLG
jgi:hypothetical protein